MDRISRFAAALLALAAVAGASAVGLAAYAAHGLARSGTNGEHAVALFSQATDFQIKHALALILITLLSEAVAGRARTVLRGAAIVMALGMLLFPTALYSSALGGPVWWAPYGGTAAMVAWIVFGVGALLAAGQRLGGTP